MTNELEKQFFDTFGIEPDITSCYHHCRKDLNCKECNEAKVIYPQITDHILLELICIRNQYLHPFTIYSTKNKFLKNDILECMISIINYFYEHEMGEYSKIKQQVHTLFEKE